MFTGLKYRQKSFLRTFSIICSSPKKYFPTLSNKLEQINDEKCYSNNDKYLPYPAAANSFFGTNFKLAELMQ